MLMLFRCRRTVLMDFVVLIDLFHINPNPNTLCIKHLSLFLRLYPSLRRCKCMPMGCIRLVFCPLRPLLAGMIQKMSRTHHAPITRHPCILHSMLPMLLSLGQIPPLHNNIHCKPHPTIILMIFGVICPIINREK